MDPFPLFFLEIFTMDALVAESNQRQMWNGRKKSLLDCMKWPVSLIFMVNFFCFNGFYQEIDTWYINDCDDCDSSMSLLRFV